MIGLINNNGVVVMTDAIVVFALVAKFDYFC